MTKLTIYDRYELVVGLEVHAQLSTQSKAYARDSAEFGGKPNHQVSPITLGHPGTLPKLNEKMVSCAIKMGLAMHCSVREYNHFARKSYFYADLPKGYQVTQDTTPICYNGYIQIPLKGGESKKIGITRIHLEEDAGKSMHDQDALDSLIDLNRAGVPLIEIVSEPDIRSGEEAHAYLTEIRKHLRFLNICDGNMEEGSLRCDANISVRRKGSTTFGNRCEVKNLNSMRHVQRAIEYEFTRQVDAIEAGQIIHQNTLNFDVISGTTSVLRSKEMANDYRYFPEPDLPPVLLEESYIAQIKANLPLLPQQLFVKYTNVYGLSSADAQYLIEHKDLSDYFQNIVQHTTHYKAAFNQLMGTVKSWLNQQAISIKSFKLPAKRIAALIHLLNSGKINHLIASQQLFPAMVQYPEKTPEELAASLGLLIQANDMQVAAFIDQVLDKYPDKIQAYHAGKKTLIGLFMGEVMQLSEGKVDPKTVSRIIIERLQQRK